MKMVWRVYGGTEERQDESDDAEEDLRMTRGMWV